MKKESDKYPLNERTGRAPVNKMLYTGLVPVSKGRDYDWIIRRREQGKGNACAGSDHFIFMMGNIRTDLTVASLRAVLFAIGRNRLHQVCVRVCGFYHENRNI